MATTAQEAWNRSVRQQRDVLGPKYAKIIAALEFDSFEKSLAQARAKYESKKTSKCLDFLKPVFQQLNAFHRGLTAMASASDGTTIVWGVLLVLVDVACNYHKFLDVFAGLLQEVTTTITRVNRYLALLPTNPLLQKLMVDVLNDYVICCIKVFKFYKSRITVNISMFFVRNVSQNFQDIKDKIQSKIRAFEEEARLDIDEILVRQARAQQLQPLPPSGIFHVPFARNEFFCGRDTTLEEIKSALSRKTKESASHQPSCLIHAMGGMGKTQVALAYAHENRSTYPYIFWIGAQNEPDVGTSFALIALKLGIPDAAHLGRAQRINAVRDWLENTDKTWLLIFDNVESMEIIQPYWPVSSLNGAILVTSQMASLSQFIRYQIPLQPFSDDDCETLLLETLRLENPSPSQKEAALTISKFVGGLPIALAHIAGLMFSSHLSLDETVEMLRRQNLSYLWPGERGSSTHAYENRLGEVWDMALKELNDVEKHLLNILSLLSPDSIPEELILSGEVLGIFAPDFSQKFSFVRSSLCRRQLVQRNVSKSGAYLSIHRSLQLNLRNRLSAEPDSYAAVFRDAGSLVREAFPSQSKTMSYQDDNWRVYDKYYPHVQALQSIAQSSSSKALVHNQMFAQLLSDAANYCWERGYMRLGIEACQLAVSIFESSPQLDLMLYSRPLTSWGLMAGEMGIPQRKQMFDCYSRCIAVRAEYLKNQPNGGDADEQLLLCNAWSDYGLGCLEAGYYDEAEKYALLSLALKSRHESEKTYAMMFGLGYWELAVVYASQGKFKEARAMADRMEKMAAVDYKPGTAAIWKFQFLKACIYFTTGDHAIALNIHQDVLVSRTSIFGPTGTFTRYSYYAVAEIYHILGALDLAESLLRRSLNQLDQSPWTDGAVARSQFKLATVLRSQGKPAVLQEAAELESMAQKCREALIPHPETIFESDNVDPASFYDHMVPVLGRTRYRYDRIKNSDPNTFVKIPDDQFDLQFIPGITYWEDD
ncbi:putative pfs domain-containing protein [Rosellinia necatrix]|uniref:Putative pfs domain-containing protein n=1 Tax=Rosellinia necatrix TaxID=77044 RepID=A0A1W2TW48_ROSNE|nr:putative pfs domain-containing protein [Rosellinia necatrix]